MEVFARTVCGVGCRGVAWSTCQCPEACTCLRNAVLTRSGGGVLGIEASHVSTDGQFGQLTVIFTFWLLCLINSSVEGLGTVPGTVPGTMPGTVPQWGGGRAGTFARTVPGWDRGPCWDLAGDRAGDRCQGPCLSGTRGQYWDLGRDHPGVGQETVPESNRGTLSGADRGTEAPDPGLRWAGARLYPLGLPTHIHTHTL